MMTGEDGGGEHQKGYEYPEAPDLLILEDEDKFRDHKGVTLDIETRVEEHPRKSTSWLKMLVKRLVWIVYSILYFPNIVM
jgi:hypothetical protein